MHYASVPAIGAIWCYQPHVNKSDHVEFFETVVCEWCCLKQSIEAIMHERKMLGCRGQFKTLRARLFAVDRNPGLVGVMIQDVVPRLVFVQVMSKRCDLKAFNGGVNRDISSLAGYQCVSVFFHASCIVDYTWIFMCSSLWSDEVLELWSCDPGQN